MFFLISFTLVQTMRVVNIPVLNFSRAIPESRAKKPDKKLTIEEVRERNLNKLKRIPGVVEVNGIKSDTKGEYLVVLTNLPLKELKGIVPTNLDGYRVKVEPVNKPVRRKSRRK